MIAFLLIAAAMAAGVALAAELEQERIPLLVLDIELVGDLGTGELAAEHAARIEKSSALLREELSRLNAYRIIDATPVQAAIDSARATQYLHRCNGCELDIAKQAGAHEVLVVWVHRVSQLILSLKFEIRRVPDGEVVYGRAFDFRGDNDASWARAVKYMVRDIQAQVD